MIHTIKTLREDEVRYRERGCFDLAVQRQRQADILESGLKAEDHICSIVDRGALGDIRFGYTANGLIAFALPSGLVWLLSPDMVVELWGACMNALELSPEFLAAVALRMAEGRALEEAATPNRNGGGR